MMPKEKLFDLTCVPRYLHEVISFTDINRLMSAIGLNIYSAIGSLSNNFWWIFPFSVQGGGEVLSPKSGEHKKCPPPPYLCLRKPLYLGAKLGAKIGGRFQLTLEGLKYPVHAISTIERAGLQVSGQVKIQPIGG